MFTRLNKPALAFFIILFPTLLFSAIPASERAALIALYNSTNGGSWTDNNGWKGNNNAADGFSEIGSENTWHGVTVIADKVVGINLSSNLLSGTLPTALGDLSNLSTLYLYTNQLTGSIPTELGNLTNLTELYLSFNQLSGSIPTELGNLSNLTGLYLDWNQFSGAIPAQFGGFSTLWDLYLNNNALSGSIPSELGNLSSLMSLDLTSNKLIGPIPTQLGNLSGLSSLGLKYNALYTHDETLRSFLTTRESDWESKQTIAPSNVAKGTVTQTSVTITWDAIAFTDYTGGYGVCFSDQSGGPYTEFGRTANKSVTSMPVTGLDPGKTYYFTVYAQTDVNVNNTNQVSSESTAQIQATTEGSLPVELSNFSAEPVSGGILVHWVTESETDNAGFVLERMAGPTHESPLQWHVFASHETHPELMGQGNSSDRHEYTFTDETVQPGETVTYRLSDVNTNGEVHIYDVIKINLPDSSQETVLEPPFPNPFNPQTKIGYHLAEPGPLEIVVYDLLGRKVRTLVNENQSAGSYNIYWHGDDALGRKTATGAYLIVLKTVDGVRTQKAVMMR